MDKQTDNNPDNDKNSSIDSETAHNTSKPSSETPNSPEPPLTWKPQQNMRFDAQHQDPAQNANADSQTQKMPSIRLDAQEAQLFKSSRNFVIGSQVLAVFSLLIGGLPLSIVASILAIIGFRKISSLVESREDLGPYGQALKRSAVLALGLAILSVVINAVFLATAYPMIMDMIQNGSFANMLPGQGAPAGTSTASPAPGAALFG